MPIVRLTDGIEDIIDLVGKITPAYMPSLLRYVLSHTGQLIIRQEIYGDLDKFLKPENILDKNVSLSHMPICKEMIKKIIIDSHREGHVNYYELVVSLSKALYQGFS
jgi:hypothetical protein